MKRLTCPRHGRLAAELFLGKLDDARAALAERALVECDTCAAWAQATALAAAPLEEAVAEGLAGFRAPRRVTHPWWLSAAAAAAIVALAVGAAWWKTTARGPSHRSRELAILAAPSADTALTSWSFESGTPGVDAPRPVEPKPAPAAPDGQVSSGGFESGDLSSWSSHT